MVKFSPDLRNSPNSVARTVDWSPSRLQILSEDHHGLSFPENIYQTTCDVVLDYGYSGSFRKDNCRPTIFGTSNYAERFGAKSIDQLSHGDLFVVENLLQLPIPQSFSLNQPSQF